MRVFGVATAFGIAAAKKLEVYFVQKAQHTRFTLSPRNRIASFGSTRELSEMTPVASMVSALSEAMSAPSAPVKAPAAEP